MNNIKWEDGAVCFGNGKQWYFNNGGKHDRPLVNIVGNEFVGFDFITGSDGFQLNEIRQGDYIEASELDTEKKYNNAVAVFELFGFSKSMVSYDRHINEYVADRFVLARGVFTSTSGSDANGEHCKRKLTYPQLMAIGKLKRAMLDKVDAKLIEISNTSELPNSSVGKKFDQGKPRFSLMPQEPLQDVMSVLEFGASKYGANNWNQVENPQQRYLDAAMRHIMAWQSGELLDEESGKPHLAHAQCCLLFLQQFDKGEK